MEGLVFSVWTPAQGPGWSSGLSDLLDICLVPIGDQPLFNVMETAVNIELDSSVLARPWVYFICTLRYSAICTHHNTLLRETLDFEQHSSYTFRGDLTLILNISAGGVLNSDFLLIHML